MDGYKIQNETSNILRSKTMIMVVEVMEERKKTMGCTGRKWRQRKRRWVVVEGKIESKPKFGLGWGSERLMGWWGLSLIKPYEAYVIWHDPSSSTTKAKVVVRVCRSSIVATPYIVHNTWSFEYLNVWLSKFWWNMDEK